MMFSELYFKSPILKFFREFYQEFLSLQALALESSWPPEESVDTKIDLSAESEKNLALRIRHKLADVINKGHQEMGGGDGYTSIYVKEALYIMVALADEIFIHLNWYGTEVWKDHLLESMMYNTQDSGERFFANLDRFLGENSVKKIDVAALYLLALGLGFKGKYRGTVHEDELFSYRDKLYRYMEGVVPFTVKETNKLFYEAYQHTFTDHPRILVPDTKPWGHALLGIGIAFIIFSSVLWIRHIHDIAPLIHELDRRSRT